MPLPEARGLYEVCCSNRSVGSFAPSVRDAWCFAMLLSIKSHAWMMMICGVNLVEDVEPSGFCMTVHDIREWRDGGRKN